MEIMVTVVTVVRNGRDEIERTISSVKSQDYQTFEHLIVDGKSDDGTIDVIRKYDQLRWISEVDTGIYDAMNKGVAAASGDWILFMNCGDEFYDKNSLQNLVNAIVIGSTDIVFGCWIRKAGTIYRVVRPDLGGRVFNHQSILYRKTLHLEFGPYLNRSKFIVSDYEFFTKVLSSKNINVRTIKQSVAIIDVFGVSRNEDNFSQKTFIDFIDGNLSRFKLLIYLAVHPAYFFIKKLIRGNL